MTPYRERREQGHYDPPTPKTDTNPETKKTTTKSTTTKTTKAKN